MQVSIKRKNIIYIGVIVILFIAIGILFILIRQKMANTKFIIDAKAEVGATTMYVANLDRMRDFYNKIIGLEIIEEKENKVVLGTNNRGVIILESKSDLEFPQMNDAGLYHNAILFDDKNILASVIKRILTEEPTLYQGTADHSVSQAFYFVDPERNGLELYIDRPRSEWKYVNGQVQMGSTYIDPQQFINSANTTDNPKVSSKMGHVHLKVGDIQKAKSYYVDVLGFEIIAEMPSALFVSAGGYHHHIGMNTWESYMASPRNKEVYGMKSVEFLISSIDELKKIENQLKNHNIEYTFQNDSLITSDPWNNQVILTVSNSLK